MTTFTPGPVTDIWTLGYDQFRRPCWQNKMTGEIHYESSGQVPAQPYTSFGCAADPNFPTCPDFTVAVGSRLEGFPLRQAILPPSTCTAQGKDAADMWTYGFDQYGRPCWLNKKTRELHYDSIRQPPAQPSRRLFTPTGPSPPSGPYFLPAAGGKKRVDEEGQWYLQRNKKGEQYYLNTTTWQWQYEIPDCLK